ncbi:hypothetical protein DRV85_04995 [Rhodosalinus halophilus]|uniref:TFIIB zinc-binding n=1 Tax=Rhodosalinus halophilus TaxID=2259333 RepID=A0A365UC23_9RHOB|nr:hypothetical protein [Rhodosalinus halophilus]RBI86776.1 hypothetical protein DRV85_04995 [Rhodosalinus halophilus]
MPHGTKIATCTYCGTRAALTLDGGRHELVCAACGAPLHDLKMLRADRVDPEAHRAPVPGAKGRRRARVAPKPPPEVRGPDPRWAPPKKRGKKRKKRKSLFRKALSEAFDAIEDIFD